MMVCLRSGGAKPPLVLIHGSDGTIDIFQGLVRHMDPARPVYGITQTFERGDRALLSLKEMAARYKSELESRIKGPYSLVGYSFGGLVALEMAHLLNKSGKTVAFLGMLDAWVPGYLARAAAAETPADKLRRRGVGWRRHARRAIIGPGRRQWFRETIVSKFFQKAYGWLSRRNRDVPRWLRNANDLNIFAVRNYQPEPYTGEIVLFRARDEVRDPRWDYTLGWCDVAHVKVEDVPGDHRTFIQTSDALLAGIISGYLP